MAKDRYADGNTKQSKFDEAKEKALTAYNENITLRALISAIPNIGGPIDLFVSGKGEQIRQKRLENFLSYLHEEAKKLKTSKLDSAFLESPEFYDLTMQAFDFSTRTRQEEKRRKFAKIVANAAQQKREASHDPEAYLRTVANLNVQEFKLANSLFLQQKNDTEKIIIADIEQYRHKLDQEQSQIIATTGLSEDECAYIYIRLQTLGLVRPFVRRGLKNWANVPFEITIFCRNFMHFISEENSSS